MVARSSNYVLEHILRPSISSLAVTLQLPQIPICRWQPDPKPPLGGRLDYFLHPGKRRGSLIFVAALRRQARVCARLAEECDDGHLAERFEIMALGLMAKADELEDLPASSAYTKKTAFHSGPQKMARLWAVT
jgi:hypothetical protein